MRTLRTMMLAAAAIFLLPAVAPKAEAQISFGINIGGRPAPVCPYGYYGYAPYRCAPYGYYGPEWFNGGVFYGAGPWFHGPQNFRGGVNHSFDPRYGYHGGYPRHGAYHEPNDHFQNFHATHQFDTHGGEQEFHGGGDHGGGEHGGGDHGHH